VTALVAVAQRLLAALRLTMTVLACALMVYMVVAVAAQVLSRYILSFPIAWASETATMAQIWMVLLGAGIAMRHDKHVGIDLLLNYLPPQVARLLTLLVLVLGLWFLWVVFQGSFRLLRVGAMQRMPALQLPMSWAYLVLPISAAYFALEFAIATWQRVRRAGPADGQRSVS
jgi:TRAP-type C4-dicarboxylate transport system permease small subunit